MTNNHRINKGTLFVKFDRSFETIFSNMICNIYLMFIRLEIMTKTYQNFQFRSNIKTYYPFRERKNELA